MLTLEKIDNSAAELWEQMGGDEGGGGGGGVRKKRRRKQSQQISDFRLFCFTKFEKI